MTPADKQSKLREILTLVAAHTLSIRRALDQIEAVYAADSTTQISDPYAEAE